MSDLPTKPGPYYWRESDEDEFQLVCIEIHIYNRNPDVVHLSLYSGEEMRMVPVKDMGGQWLPIPTADELVELQAKAKAKAYDEGTQQIAVYSEVIWSDNYLNMLEKADLTFGSPKVRVRVCKEVVV